jgi:broad specificity phosphatase PhoE
MSTLLLLRHGETDWNRERRLMGSLDIPLNEAGRRQARAVADLLVGFGVEVILSSVMVRAMQTAAIIAEVLGLPVVEDEGLVEVRFGQWQGHTYEEIAADPRFLDYVRDPVATATPGGETIADVQRRAVDAVGGLIGVRRALVVSHGDVIRSLLSHFLGMPLGEFRRIRVDNCGLSGIANGPAGMEVKFVNTLADPQRAWDPVHWSRNA